MLDHLAVMILEAYVCNCEWGDTWCFRTCGMVKFFNWAHFGRSPNTISKNEIHKPSACEVNCSKIFCLVGNCNSKFDFLLFSVALEQLSYIWLLLQIYFHDEAYERVTSNKTWLRSRIRSYDIHNCNSFSGITSVLLHVDIVCTQNACGLLL
jgi:hypothetical protein